MFASPKSFVDTPFFSALATHKLEHAKLSSEPVPLTGVLAVPAARGRPVSLQLSGSSFNAPQSASQYARSRPLIYEVAGTLLNVNTLEEFRDTDKPALLTARAAALARSAIVSGAALRDPRKLLEFTILSFADLKKYKFYYWVMCPVLKWTSTVEFLDDPASSELDSALASCTQPIVELVPGGSSGSSSSSSSSSNNNNSWTISETLTLKSGVYALCGFAQPGGEAYQLPAYIRNFAALLAFHKIDSAKLYVYSPNGAGSRWVQLHVGSLSDDELLNGATAEGYERNAQNRLLPKLADVSSLMDPLQLASEAVDLNLKLMKWRAAPQIDLDGISGARCLLLGAGTLGSYIARGLMAWGVKHITFVDNGTVSYSNPVRQPLYTHADCIAHSPKAEAAAKQLRSVFPNVVSSGHALEIPMAGHSVTNRERQRREHDELVELIDKHDVVFLLMDSRESRWLPTVVAAALQKLVINVALGFDSYLVMRHGLNRHLGCYFCNDVVAPMDSVSRLALDQMCTVTRPGCAMVASGHAVELLARVYQHKSRGLAEINAPSILGPISHQLRGFLSTQQTHSVGGPAFPSCSACGPAVELWKEHGWDFVERALNDPAYIAEVSGLAELQRLTEEIDIDLSDDDGELKEEA